MIRKKRVAVVIGVGVMVAVGSARVMLRVLAEGPATQVAATMSAASQPKPAFAAMDYYDQSCSKCHGPQGSFYGKSLGKDLDDKGLVKVVRDMANGPAEAPIEEEEVMAETAFHRSLMEGTPYLSVTGIEGTTWKGEAMVDAKVVVKVGGKEIAAKVTDWNWTAEVPAGTKVGEVEISAELEGKKTVVRPGVGMYSHTEAILSPKARKKK